MPPIFPLGALLAGGASTRFGAPKALARVGGVPVAERVARALRDAVPEAGAVANDPSLVAGTGLPVRPDACPGLGPLGGVLTALRWAEERGRPGALCVACDLPFTPVGLLRLLAASFAAGRTVVPESPGRRGFEPLCAVYPVAALPRLEAMLDAGERRAAALADALGAVRIPLREVEAFGAPDVLFLNLNTPRDHRRAQELARAAENVR